MTIPSVITTETPRATPQTRAPTRISRKASLKSVQIWFSPRPATSETTTAIATKAPPISSNPSPSVRTETTKTTNSTSATTPAAFWRPRKAAGAVSPDEAAMVSRGSRGSWRRAISRRARRTTKMAAAVCTIRKKTNR